MPVLKIRNAKPFRKSALQYPAKHHTAKDGPRAWRRIIDSDQDRQRLNDTRVPLALAAMRAAGRRVA
jgi:hypothetical protein